MCVEVGARLASPDRAADFSRQHLANFVWALATLEYDPGGGCGDCDHDSSCDHDHDHCDQGCDQDYDAGHGHELWVDTVRNARIQC
jgi:hypothetical protein